MNERRVLLLCTRQLHGESLENLLCTLEGVTLIGPWVLDATILPRIAEDRPDVVIIAEDEDQPETVSALMAQILERFPDLPLILSSLTRNVVRVYTSHELPASTDSLVEAIQSLSINDGQ